MTELTPQGFIRTLTNDVLAAHERARLDDTPGHRRELVRSVFAAIEGLQWQLRQDVMKHVKEFDYELSLHEQAALLEEAYTVDDRGNVNTQPRFLPLPVAIRLVIRIVQRYRVSYTVDFNDTGWASLKEAVGFRNRLVHPKTIEDLTVTDEELGKSMSALFWMLALVLEVFKETHDFLKNFKAEVESLLADIRAGKPIPLEDC